MKGWKKPTRWHSDSMNQTVRHCFRILYIQSSKPPDLSTGETRTENSISSWNKTKRSDQSFGNRNCPSSNLMSKHFRWAKLEDSQQINSKPVFSVYESLKSLKWNEWMKCMPWQWWSMYWQPIYSGSIELVHIGLYGLSYFEKNNRFYLIIQ